MDGMDACMQKNEVLSTKMAMSLLKIYIHLLKQSTHDGIITRDLEG
jgi:hypothetical protein